MAAPGSGGPEFRQDVPGLQAERTGLSWERTALALLGNAALLLVRSLGGIGREALLPGVVALVSALAVAALGSCRSRQIGRGDARPAARTVYATGGMVVLVGVAALLTLIGALR
jgi:putative membrane protein